MEDTHVWVMNADGTGRRDVGAAIDNRQGVPQWTSDGSAVLFTVQERGNVRLYRVPGARGGKPEVVVNDRGTVGSFSAAKNTIAYTLATPSDQAGSSIVAGRKLTDLNARCSATSRSPRSSRSPSCPTTTSSRSRRS